MSGGKKYRMMPNIDSTKPNTIRAPTTRRNARAVRSELVATRKSRMLSSISPKWRMTLAVSGAWLSPLMNDTMASNTKMITNRVGEVVTNSSERWVTMRLIQTKNNPIE